MPGKNYVFEGLERYNRPMALTVDGVHAFYAELNIGLCCGQGVYFRGQDTRLILMGPIIGTQNFNHNHLPFTKS